MITELYCQVDDFNIENTEAIKRQLIANGQKRQREGKLSLSEIMTILINFQQQRYRQFKAYYEFYVKVVLKKAFPTLPSYNRFIELVPRAIYPMLCFLKQLLGKSHGIGFIDSTKISVCDNRRIHSHKLFKPFAQRGKTSTGWFYGFKLHMVINHLGEITALKLTAGNQHDTAVVQELLTNHQGIVVGDKGYLSKTLQNSLETQGVKLITKVRKNMKQPVYSDCELALLNKRALIETVFDQLKNLFQIEHSRHRSLSGFISNLLSALIAYSLSPIKPSLL